MFKLLEGYPPMCTCRSLCCTRDTETHQRTTMPTSSNNHWKKTCSSGFVAGNVRICLNSWHRFKVQTFLQPSKCLLGLLYKGGMDTVEQAKSPGGILWPLIFRMNLVLRRSTSPTSGRCPLHEISCYAHEQFWPGGGAFPLGSHNLKGVGWVLTWFDFDSSCIETWAHSCARHRETSLTRSLTEWM